MSVKKSIFDIQLEEEELKSKQDLMCANLDGKWYVERRERADSLHQIQKSEEEERARQKLVEEQKEMEKKMLQERVKSENEKKKRSNKNRGKPSKHRTSRGQRKNSNARFDGDSIKEHDRDHQKKVDR